MTYRGLLAAIELATKLKERETSLIFAITQYSEGWTEISRRQHEDTLKEVIQQLSKEIN
jgi:hypothetical protein